MWLFPPKLLDAQPWRPDSQGIGKTLSAESWFRHGLDAEGGNLNDAGAPHQRFRVSRPKLTSSVLNPFR